MYVVPDADVYCHNTRRRYNSTSVGRMVVALAAVSQQHIGRYTTKCCFSFVFLSFSFS